MTTDTVGGVFTYSTELCRALLPHGVRVILVTMGGRLSPAQCHVIQRLENVTLMETEYRLEWMAEPWQDVDAAGELLLSIEKECAGDAVHLNGYAHASLPWRTRPLVVGHSCVLSWWEAVKGCAAPREWQDYHHRVRSGLQSAGCVAAPSAAMMTALQRHYGPLRETAVIPNSVSGLETGKRSKEPFILSAGRMWDEAKNVALLRGTAPLLSWPTVVAGGGEPTAADGAFRVLGALDRDKTREWMARAAIYASPALYEPFGLAILEAAQAGCALVLADIPSLRENWEGAAVFADPHKPLEFAEALQRLIEYPQERLRLQAAARRRSAAFDCRRTAEEYLKLYERLAPSRVRQVAAGRPG